MLLIDLPKKRLEIILYRCGCNHCDQAYRELGRLSKRYEIRLNVRCVENEAGLKDWAGWKTPAVQVGGRLVTQYEINAHKWEEAIQKGLEEHIPEQRVNAEERRAALVLLHRCGCEHCDDTERELARLAARYRAEFQVKFVDKEEMADLAGWETPIVEVNGKLVTRYEFNVRKWEHAIQSAGAFKSEK